MPCKPETPSTSALQKPDSRAHARFGVAMSLSMDGVECQTHDLSEDGVLFESWVAPRVGARVSLKLHCGPVLARGRLSRQGHVVRVDNVGDNYNVAVRFTQPLYR